MCTYTHARLARLLRPTGCLLTAHVALHSPAKLEGLSLASTCSKSTSRLDPVHTVELGWLEGGRARTQDGFLPPPARLNTESCGRADPFPFPSDGHGGHALAPATLGA